MGKKYRMKTLWAYDDCSDVGIELEPLEQEEKPSQWNCLNCGKSYFIEPANDLDVDCPASECDGEMCECDINLDTTMYQQEHEFDENNNCAKDAMNELYGKPKETNEPYNCGCNINECFCDVKEPNESLEEKKLVDKFGYYKPKHCTDMNGEMSGHDCYALAQIAKEHYQEHPEELGLQEHWKQMYDGAIKSCVTMADTIEGMVSIDSVLRVFDETFYGTNDAKFKYRMDCARKSIEKLGG